MIIFKSTILKNILCLKEKIKGKKFYNSIENNMEKLLLLGDEAIAQGAIDSGMSGMYAYPGTPSTEIM